jgi:ParB/RepB/Spo0J family partition protein
VELIQIPPAKLVPHENNAHSELRDIDSLAQTVANYGIIQPLVVLPADAEGHHTIVAGHRRHAAATQVGLETVPCVVVDDPGAADQLVTMLIENLHRDGLTLAEEAHAYEQLALMDWEPERIAQAAGRDIERVQQSLTLRKLPEQIQEAANAGSVDLISAAALTEFAHDPKAIERIMKKGGGHWGYQHAIADERHHQRRRHEIEVLKAELVLAGVKLTARPQFVDEGGKAVLVDHLVDDAGDPVDVEEVKAKPGFAAYINRDYTPKPVFYCPDPGSVDLRPAPDTWAAQAAEREAREAETAARRAAWETATSVRRDFLLAHFANIKGAKRLLRPALRKLAGARVNLPFNALREFADALCGCPLDDLPENASVDRLTRAAVARWLAYSEENLHEAAFGRFGDVEEALAYLDLLIGEGYELAHIESQLHQSITDGLAEEEGEKKNAAGKPDDEPDKDIVIEPSTASNVDGDKDLAEDIEEVNALLTA